MKLSDFRPTDRVLLRAAWDAELHSALVDCRRSVLVIAVAVNRDEIHQHHMDADPTQQIVALADIEGLGSEEIPRAGDKTYTVQDLSDVVHIQIWRATNKK